MLEPTFLACLDNAMPTDTGWIAQCPVFGCANLLHIEPVDGWWTLQCDDHDQHAMSAYLQLDDLRVDKRPGVRAWLCLRLALTPDAWAGLILGRNVNPAAIDQHELRAQRRSGLWL